MVPPVVLMQKKRVAVHKFSSCDGCQLALLNAGPALLALAQRVEFVHFIEAGLINEDADVDIAFVEGSISTPDELERIQRVRSKTRYLVTIGACATSGGLQALRNEADAGAWTRDVYSKPEFIAALPTATAVARHVRVDFELWGCPINTEQIVAVLNSLVRGVVPVDRNDSVCLSCKRDGNVCVMVTKQVPCLGPVTRTGCGALCPRFGRDCFGCYGPAERANVAALGRRYEGFGLLPEDIVRRFRFIHSDAEPFRGVGVVPRPLS